MTATVVWITGATRGLGAGLVRTCPYEGARIINASRSAHPDLENIRFDLGEPSTWSALRESFDKVLDGFTGKRAIFVHNALFDGSTGYAGEMDERLYYRDVIGNSAAPLVLADWFLRAVGPSSGYESGILLMSSAAARMPIEGHSVYGAAKAGVEHWVRAVRRERARRGTGPWVVAVRPGMVDSATTRREAELDPAVYPMAPHLAAAFAAGEALTPDDAARDIWAAMPPPPDTSVLLFGAPPSGAMIGKSASAASAVETGR
ncbi:SDR family NAD(P)-dependent oxidoreductase [Nocardia sp. CA2R105]|uniref:SDR family NAD(P)-dependent oxidoreductase n=1 Tax=Nocardia coffeae TaxID=2873381 RepID=UPI001CA682DF|nr:SDR family NAD(P)-dependent oxidoreductase [Nocardia coffeae]MBY8862869.1 SDR family NAD(P)-dependent oxidoreductase [Nocardia coffeae]